MRVDGRWYRCPDGVVRPVIRGAVMRSDGAPVIRFFLVDTGADRTVLSQDVLLNLDLPLREPSERLAGVGGAVTTFEVDTELVFVRDSGQAVPIRGRYSVVTDPSALDMSVLGRDVLGLFAVIVDQPGGTVCLLNQHHGYSISAR